MLSCINQAQIFAAKNKENLPRVHVHVQNPRPNFGRKCLVLCSRRHKLRLSRIESSQKTRHKFSNAASHSIFPSFFRLLTPPNVESYVQLDLCPFGLTNQYININLYILLNNNWIVFRVESMSSCMSSYIYVHLG